jgi:hypothetical protein
MMKYNDSKEGVKTKVGYPFWFDDMDRIVKQEPGLGYGLGLLNKDLDFRRSSNELYDMIVGIDSRLNLDDINVWKRGIPSLEERPFEVFVLPIT